jgi:hypothetical protein
MCSGALATNGPPNPHILLKHCIMGREFYCKHSLVLNACGQNAVVIKWGAYRAVFCYVLDLSRSRRSVVDITTRIRAGWFGVRILVGERNFYLLQKSRSPRAHPASI